jgi:LDH2 family malate/lactate/ureidoglycolate dehydrogenase
MDNWIKTFRAAKPIDPNNPVQIPGDQERLAEKERMIHGIPINDQVIKDLQELAGSLNIEFPKAS